MYTTQSYSSAHPEEAMVSNLIPVGFEMRPLVVALWQQCQVGVLLKYWRFAPCSGGLFRSAAGDWRGVREVVRPHHADHKQVISA